MVQRPLPQDDPLQRQPVIDLARSVLGWEPQIPLAQGLQPTIAHFRDELTV
jgi:UDP-glucuronate decarboxylase